MLNIQKNCNTGQVEDGHCGCTTKPPCGKSFPVLTPVI